MHKQPIFKEETPIKGNTLAEERQQIQRDRLTKKDKPRLLTALKVIGMCMPLVTTLGLLLWVLIKF